MLFLRAGEGVLRTGLDDLEAGSEPGGIRSAEGVRIETHAITDAAGAGAPVTEMHGDGIISMTGKDPDGRPHFAPCVVEFDEVLVLPAVLLSGARAHQGGVIPSELGERLGQFLQPAVVGEAAVGNVDVGPENDFEALALGRLRRWGARAFE